MSDFIDRQIALYEMKYGAVIDQCELDTAEPEPKIIHCKDCKFAHLTAEGEVKYCDVWFPEEKTYLSADDFCSSAEKRGE